MLIWTRAKKSSHPLADEDGAKDLLAQLSSADSLSGLQRLCELVDGLKVARGIETARLYEIVDAVDRIGRVHYRSISQEFLNHRHRLTRYQENRIWVTAGEYVTQLAEAYQWWLAQFLSTKRGPTEGQTHFTRAIGR